jgi:hypothetical protein
MYGNNRSNRGYNSGYNRGYGGGSNYGYNRGSSGGYSSGYNRGYGGGSNYGYSRGSNSGYNNGYNRSSNYGYNRSSGCGGSSSQPQSRYGGSRSYHDGNRGDFNPRRRENAYAYDNYGARYGIDHDRPDYTNRFGASRPHYHGSAGPNYGGDYADRSLPFRRAVRRLLHPSKFSHYHCVVD